MLGQSTKHILPNGCFLMVMNPTVKKVKKSPEKQIQGMVTGQQKKKNNTAWKPIKCVFVGGKNIWRMMFFRGFYQGTIGCTLTVNMVFIAFSRDI